MRRVLRPMRPDEVDSVVTVQQEAQWPPSDISFPRTHTHPARCGAATLAVRALSVRRPVLRRRRTRSRCGRFRSDQWQPIAALRNCQINVGIRTCWTGHDEVLDYLREQGHYRAWLSVLEQNGRARRFYEKRGWVPTGRSLQSGFPPHPILLGYERDLTEP
jgi:diamine N-acetyltransferase